MADLKDLKTWAVNDAAQAFYASHPFEQLNSNLPEDTGRFAWQVLKRLSGDTLDQVPGFKNMTRDLKRYMLSVIYAAFILGYKAGKGIEDIPNKPARYDA